MVAVATVGEQMTPKSRRRRLKVEYNAGGTDDVKSRWQAVRKVRADAKTAISTTIAAVVVEHGVAEGDASVDDSPQTPFRSGIMKPAAMAM